MAVLFDNVGGVFNDNGNGRGTKHGWKAHIGLQISDPRTSSLPLGPLSDPPPTPSCFLQVLFLRRKVICAITASYAFRTSEKVRATQIRTESPVSNSWQTENGPGHRNALLHPLDADPTSFTDIERLRCPPL